MTSGFPGIDTATALKRTGGNRKRYESLLQRFANSQSHVLDDIRAALAANDAPTAQRIAHSLKGASANLGATSLAEVAAAAEAAIDSNQSIAPALESLSRSLGLTIAAIRARTSRPLCFLQHSFSKRRPRHCRTTPRSSQETPRNRRRRCI